METQITKQEEALVAKRCLDFFRVHRDLRLDANKQLLMDYMNTHMLSPTVAENWELALMANCSRMAKRAQNERTEPEPEPQPEPHAPPQFNDPYWNKEQLRKTLREAFPTKAQMLQERDEKIKALRLPAEYTIQKLKQMRADEIRTLAKNVAIAAGLGADQKAGLVAVDRRLGGIN